MIFILLRRYYIYWKSGNTNSQINTVQTKRYEQKIRWKYLTLLIQAAFLRQK